MIEIGHERTCGCDGRRQSCLSAGEWLRDQVGVWRVWYRGDEIRRKGEHLAAFPVELAKRVIALFTHEGELVVDPFVGSGTTLVAARELNRNAVGFDLHGGYVEICKRRLGGGVLFNDSRQIVIQEDARRVSGYFRSGTVSLIWTSPPYANALNRRRKNATRRRGRRDERYGAIDQYSQDIRDLGTMCYEEYIGAIGEIFGGLFGLLRPGGHCVINVADIWDGGRRITLHVGVIEELGKRGYELRNIIIWDKTNIVNKVGIFGWPVNYITMGITYEYLLDFWRPR